MGRVLDVISYMWHNLEYYDIYFILFALLPFAALAIALTPPYEVRALAICSFAAIILTLGFATWGYDDFKSVWTLLGYGKLPFWVKPAHWLAPILTVATVFFVTKWLERKWHQRRAKMVR